MTIAAPTLIEAFSTLAPGYDAVLCDVWGVVHNGVRAFPAAGEALTRFRERGGTVMLISNAPRPGNWVMRSLDDLGVVRQAYDGIVTSGDLARNYVSGRPGETVFHIGPERDLGIFDGLDIRFGALAEADYAICSGLFDDDRETPEDYRALLGEMRTRDLFMVCANPDLVVERGDRLVYCAGSVADLYATLGGEVLYAGKPHRPIYEAALARIAALRATSPDPARVLAIGDSVRTDLAGAHGFGIDCLFVTRGIHSEDFEGVDQLDPASVKELFGHPPRALMRELRW
jgi:HAD superfamily hydrolase (TIGR01459 family)